LIPDELSWDDAIVIIDTRQQDFPTHWRAALESDGGIFEFAQIATARELRGNEVGLNPTPQVLGTAQ